MKHLMLIAEILLVALILIYVVMRMRAAGR
jgi:hypothetical protein